MTMVEFTEPAMRPPQEAGSILLRATQGCTYNQCNFCYVSRGYPFAAVTPEQMERELVSVKARYQDKAMVYLTGSNPFALPTGQLKTYLEVIRKHLPNLSGFSMQTRIGDLPAKSLTELQELKAQGLSHLYTGTENGNDYALEIMNKGHSAREAVEQLHRLDEAGIEYVTFYILGMAGRGRGRESAAATAEMFNQVRPRRITTTGMTIFPDTPIHDLVTEGKSEAASEKEKIEEMMTFLELLTIDTFFDAVHYLNPVNYRFRTSSDKSEVIAEIRGFLAKYSESELETMVARHMMRSL